VEAAGVEPASEKVRNEKNYVRIRFKVFEQRLRTGKNDATLARLISAFGSEQKLSTYPVK
jgi:hypothetical protein